MVFVDMLCIRAQKQWKTLFTSFPVSFLDFLCRSVRYRFHLVCFACLSAPSSLIKLGEILIRGIFDIPQLQSVAVACAQKGLY